MPQITNGSMRSPEDEWSLFTLPKSLLEMSVEHAGEEQGPIPEIRIFGNRQGMASLANILLWLNAGLWDTSSLSLAELQFVRVTDKTSLLIQLVDEQPVGMYGRIFRIEKTHAFEWQLTESNLERLAILLHRLASNFYHEYDTLPFDRVSWDAMVHFRLTDVQDYLSS